MGKVTITHGEKVRSPHQRKTPRCESESRARGTNVRLASADPIVPVNRRHPLRVFPRINRSNLRYETLSRVRTYRKTLLCASIVSAFLLTHPSLAGTGADDAGNFLRTAFTQQWGTTAGDVTTGIAIDSDTNTYVVGYTSGDLEAGQHVCGEDIFLSKHDNNGTLVWTRQWGSCGNDRAQAVAIAPNGNIYVAGHANGRLPGGSYIANSDAFISLYDADGNWKATEEFGTDGQDQVRSITVDASDDIYVAGWTDRSIHGQPYAGLNDAFVSKFDSTLALKWTTQMGSSNYDRANGVAVDAARNVYVTGFSCSSSAPTTFVPIRGSLIGQRRRGRRGG
ncbi:MAG: SBBP repeat-containing protein [Acidiferrobacterales bacterium]